VCSKSLRNAHSWSRGGETTLINQSINQTYSHFPEDDFFLGTPYIIRFQFAKDVFIVYQTQ